MPCDLIVQEGGDYCMQLNGNQGDLQADVQAFVADKDVECIDEYTSVDGDHGRIEERSYRVYGVPDYLAETHQWPHLEAFVHVMSKRTVNQTASKVVSRKWWKLFHGVSERLIVWLCYAARSRISLSG